MPLESATKTWNDKIKATIRYPSEHDTPGAAQSYAVMAVVDSVEISGIGYNHALRSGMYSWNQIMVTMKNESQGGRLLVAQTEPALAMLFWLMEHDLEFDVILEELPSDQNPGAGQWQNPQRALFGCKVDPMDERYDGDLPFMTVPFTYSRYGYVSAGDGTFKMIGDGSLRAPTGTPPGIDS